MTTEIAFWIYLYDKELDLVDDIVAAGIVAEIREKYAEFHNLNEAVSEFHNQ